MKTIDWNLPPVKPKLKKLATLRDGTKVLIHHGNEDPDSCCNSKNYKFYWWSGTGCYKETHYIPEYRPHKWDIIKIEDLK